MILARCPDCQTTFRVTPEQLKARGGKVRCGKCRSVFNALDTLVDEGREMVPPPVVEEPVAAVDVQPTDENLSGSATAESAVISVLPPVPEPADTEADAAETLVPPEAESTPAAAPHAVTAEPEALALESAHQSPVEPRFASPFLTPVADPGNPPADAPVAATDDAAQGSVRETRELPGYSKWAERVVAGTEATAIAEPPGNSRWPAVLFSLLLLLGLLGQATYHFRSEIGARVPESRPWLLEACAALGCSVPLPRQTDAISIEGSELQADNARGGLLVLQASLRNRAAFAQAYPALELTLTDTQDRMVSRRVLMPVDYLTAGIDAAGSFAGGSDLAIRLWIDARESGAAGYRLYVFHP